MNIQVEKIEAKEHAEHRSGVYAIVQPKEKKVYVGLAFDFYHRWLSHINSIASGENKGSNDKLVKETEKEFIILRVWYPETNLDDNEKQHDILLNHETLVMHAFRTMGYELYNGNENGRDDLGNKRKHLILSDELQENVLREYTKSCLRPDCDNFEELLTKAEVDVENALRRKFDTYKLTDENWRAVLSDIIKKYLQKELSIKDLQSFGLEKMTKEQIFDMIDSERIVYHKFGNYLDQSYQTIIRTKQYDLAHNRMKDIGGICPEEPDAPVCFWSVKNLGKWSQNFLSYNNTNNNTNNNTKKGKRYMLMQYTPSPKKAVREPDKVDLLNPPPKKAEREPDKVDLLNPHDGESMEEFKKRLQNGRLDSFTCTQQYSVTPDKKVSSVHYPYPQNMIPSINESHELQYIFLISKLYYIDAHFENIDVVQQCFEPTVKDEKNPDKTLANQKLNAAICTSPFDNKRKTLKELLTQDSKTGKTLFLAAELSYPYMIYLPANPYPLLSHYLGYYDDSNKTPQFVVVEPGGKAAPQYYVLCGKKIWINNDVTDKNEVKELIKTVKPDGKFKLAVKGSGDELTEYIHIDFNNDEHKTIALSNRTRQKQRKTEYPFGDKYYCAVVFNYSKGKILFLSNYDNETTSNKNFNFYLDGQIL